MTEAVAHAAVALALIAAYLAVTLTGGDANAILGVLGGYIGGAGVAKAASSPKAP